MVKNPRDPIELAHRNWQRQGWHEAAGPLAAVASIMRAQQILLGQAHQVLKPYDLTFARYELLALLNFSQEERMLMSRASALLQVHPTSVTHAVDRLEKDGLVRRQTLEHDRRALELQLTDAGRNLVQRATTALNDTFFTQTGLSDDDAHQIFDILRRLRHAAGDFD